jgi:hypothetical protein
MFFDAVISTYIRVITYLKKYVSFYVFRCSQLPLLRKVLFLGSTTLYPVDLFKSACQVYLIPDEHTQYQVDLTVPDRSTFLMGTTDCTI